MPQVKYPPRGLTQAATIVAPHQLPGSAQPQVLKLPGKQHTFFGGDGPKLIADHAIGLDQPIAVEASEKASRAVPQLQAAVLACGAHRNEVRRCGKRAIPERRRCRAGSGEASYFCRHFGPIKGAHNC